MPQTGHFFMAIKLFEFIFQIYPAIPTALYTIALRTLAGPKIHATKLNPNNPIKPQFKDPIIINGINKYLFKSFIFFPFGLFKLNELDIIISYF